MVTGGQTGYQNWALNPDVFTKLGERLGQYSSSLASVPSKTGQGPLRSRPNRQTAPT